MLVSRWAVPMYLAAAIVLAIICLAAAAGVLTLPPPNPGVFRRAGAPGVRREPRRLGLPRPW